MHCELACFKCNWAGPFGPIIHPWSSSSSSSGGASRCLGLMQACDTAKKTPKASPPSFVLKIVENEGVVESGRRNCLRASSCSGQATMTCYAVWRGSPHWQLCGSNELGRKRAVYSPVKACPVSSLMHVATMGLGNLVMPRTNGGGYPSGGFVSAR